MTAITSRSKADQVRAVGAHDVIFRDEGMPEAAGAEAFTVIIDNVAGKDFGTLMKVLKRCGRYVSSGAIAGPMVRLDWRDVYLKDLTLIGCTAWDEPVFPNLLGYVERGEIKPWLAGVYPLAGIVEAQKDFLRKQHTGKLVLIPPDVN